MMLNLKDSIIPSIKFINRISDKNIILKRLRFQKNEYSQILAKFTNVKYSSKGVNIEVKFSDKLKLKSINKRFENNDILSNEAYYIKWFKDKVEIEVLNKRGVLNAIVTIAQFINNKKNIPECEIFDYPDLRIRGVHLDLKFHNYSLTYIKKFIDKLLYYKVNTILLEYEDKFPLEKFSDIKSLIAFGEDEIKEIIEYSNSLGIDIIPLQQSLGHSEYILRLEKYSHLRENPDSIMQFCPLNKDTFNFITSIYDEYLKYHTSQYFHIGSDEAWFLGYCDKCKKYVERYGKDKLFINYINKLIKYLNKKGKIAILWGDMIEKNKKNYTLLKGKYILMYWDYVSSTKFQFDKFYNGENTISVSAIRMMADGSIFPDYDFHIKNIYGFIKSSVTNNYLGHIVSGWAISRIPLSATLPGLIAGAEFSWSSNSDITLFNKKLLSFYFNTKDERLIDVIYNINHNISYEVKKEEINIEKEHNDILSLKSKIKSIKNIKKNKIFINFINAGFYFKNYKYNKLIIKKAIEDFNFNKINKKKFITNLQNVLISMERYLHKIEKIYQKIYYPELRGFGKDNENKILIEDEIKNIKLFKSMLDYIKDNNINYITISKIPLLEDYFTKLKNKKGEFHKGYLRGMESWFNYSL